ncbi:MAG: heavy metal-binding domain-containing protein [Bacteroidota bacterium]
MTTELTQCPNCGTKLKDGILSSVKLLSENKTNIINEYHDEKASGYCNKCGDSLYKSYKGYVLTEREELTEQIQEIIEALPIISTHLPLNWDYDLIGIITGQSTTGNGALTEFLSASSNFWGTQSGRYNKKIKEGENFCFTQLRKQTLDLGGNAIIATDVDYSEIGGEKGMLMVCMTGTAIRLKNLSVLGKEREENIGQLTELNDRIRVLSFY